MARNKAYREAEEKIEVARRSGATELNLSNPGKPPDEKRTELPETLWQLAELQSLNLSHTQLTAVPETIGQLTQLRELNLSYNKLTAVPEIIGQLSQLRLLNLSYNKLTAVPETIGQLTELRELNLGDNQLTILSDSLGNLTQLLSLKIATNQLTILPASLTRLKKLKLLWFGGNELSTIPDWIVKLQYLEDLAIGGNGLRDIPSSIRLPTSVKTIWLGWSPHNSLFKKIPDCIRSLKNLSNLEASYCILESLPDWLGELAEIKKISLDKNRLLDLPPSLAQLEHLEELSLGDNPLNPELAAAYNEGLHAVKAYLRAKAGAQIRLNEAKLILVGEGEVGKTCLMDALEGKPWEEHPTTHGIEIRTITAVDPESGTEITLNGWDFGGQRVYRPTHQLFFSSPAVYLVVWKPREGPQQGFVKEWIKLIKHREPEAKILVVATHGGPQQRQPDIDRQELWDLFGKEMVLDFFLVDSKPDKNGQRRGIEALKEAIARAASALPEMGREVPESFQKVRQALAETEAAYLPLDDVYNICRQHGMDDEVAALFVTISHRLGHFIHYETDPALRDIVILKPNWLATAISFVLDDEATRQAQGLVPFSRLGQLWDDPNHKEEERYSADLHPIFLRLMERFDLSYRVAGLTPKDSANPTSLIGQLVPDTRPQSRLEAAWPETVTPGDNQQVQICKIVDEKGNSAPAEGLFYQLIVRLHQYSLGRTYYHNSVHWQRGLVLDDDYNGRALLQHLGNDVQITVRAPYPEGFLHRLTGEVKYLVESFWEGLRCDVMVPCIHPCGQDAPGTGLYEVEKLIDSKRKFRPEYPCSVCHEWQNIDSLLRNAPAAQPMSAEFLFAEFTTVKEEIAKVRSEVIHRSDTQIGRFDRLDNRTRRILSRIDDTYANLLQALTDEAKEGPRLFSFVPVDRSNFNPKSWIRHKFRLTLWCEHSRLPLPILNGKESQKGVYEIELTRDWFKKAGPYLKLLTGTLSLALPVALSAVKFDLNEPDYKAIEEQLDLSSNIIDATIGESAKVGEFLGTADTTTLEHGDLIRAQGGVLRELHTILKKKDPSFGGLVRVSNKRQEFLWVHERFAGEY